MTAHWVADHYVKVGKAKLGIGVINSIGENGSQVSCGVAIPMIYSKGVSPSQESYDVACDTLIAAIDERIVELQAVRERFTQAQCMYQMTGEIPDVV